MAGVRPALWLAAAAGLGLALARRRPQADLRGDVALVTGASRGLGFLLARELARHGCRLAICARDPEELERARWDLESAGARVVAFPCDVGDRDAVERMVAEAERHYGRIDVLINNAGIIQVGPVQTMRHADFEAALAVNFWGVVHPTLAVLPRMRARRQGRIVNITSIGGKVSVPHLLPYTSAKFAAVGFSEGLAAEVAREGIRVTTIVPGLMRTGSYLRASFDGRQREEFTWFSLGSTLPLVSMDAERAARQIVRALRRGDRERILSLPAAVLARAHGLFPDTSVAVMSAINRWLPQADAGGGQARGLEVDQELRSPLLRLATRLGRTAARRFKQYPGARQEAS